MQWFSTGIKFMLLIPLVVHSEKETNRFLYLYKKFVLKISKNINCDIWEDEMVILIDLQIVSI